MQSDHQQIDLILTDEADNSLNGFSIHQMGVKLDLLALCRSARCGLQSLVELVAILIEGLPEGPGPCRWRTPCKLEALPSR
jgi:hypothetical protein